MRNLWLGLLIGFAGIAGCYANPVFTAEVDGRQVSLVDGGAAFSPDGRYAYWGSADGWIVKSDLQNRSQVTKAHIGERVGAPSVSSDGRWVLVVDPRSRGLKLLDADLQLVLGYPAPQAPAKGAACIPVARDTPARRSFVIGCAGSPDLWEISYDPNAGPIFDGLVHDYRNGEAISRPGFLGIRRTLLDIPMDDLFLESGSPYVLGLARLKDDSVEVVNLDIRRRVAPLALSGQPHPGAAVAFQSKGTRMIAMPHGTKAVVSVIDIQSWRTTRVLNTPAPGVLLWSHPSSAYIWVSTPVDSAGKSTLTFVDKNTLAYAGATQELTGTVDHITFSHAGKYAVVRLSGRDNLRRVYDAYTLRQVATVPIDP